jgi:hypothetical protein
MPRSIRPIGCALVASLALAAAPAAPAGDLAPHRAVYQLGKGAPRAGQAIASVVGTMALEIDESCEGWSLSQRIRMSIADAMGEEMETDTRYASYETKDGTSMRFQASDWQDGELIEETAGAAERPAPDKPGVASFVKPEKQSFDLPPGTLFPVAFNVELLKRLRNSEPFAGMHGFDGGNLEGAYSITVFVGKERPSELKPPAGGAAARDDRAKLVGGPVRNVRVAYFPLTGNAPEPELEYEMELQPNGVSPVMRMDYQRYQVVARLVEIKALPVPACKP